MRTRMAMSHVTLFLNNDTVYIHVHVTKVCRPINVDVTHPRARHLIVDYIPHVLLIFPEISLPSKKDTPASGGLLP